MLPTVSLFVRLTLIVLQSLFLLEAECSDDYKYCYKKLLCNSQTHTMCQFQRSTPSPQCPKVISFKLSQQEKTELLEYHNYFRRRVALGEETRGNPGPQPAATNMILLTWDNELAQIAERWALQCHINPLEHDKCRDVDRFQVGQNIFQGSASSAKNPALSMSSAVTSWYNEVDMFDGRQVSQFRFSSNTGHYSQLVWAKTEKIGCGVVTYTYNYYGYNMIGKLVVCNYGPAGNYQGQPMYKTM